jgi:hypothetical protein
MVEQALVWLIVAVAVVYAVRKIAQSLRRGGDHCGDCGLDERKQGDRDRR